MSFFIAEVSSNHSKDLNRALEFIDSAAEIGCDAVKFQLFKVEKLFASEILDKSKKHRDRKDWELPLNFLPILHERCIKNKIQFSCTPFYLDAVSELEPYVSFYKIASYELLWDDLLKKCALTGKPVIISTGMANIEEIKHAVSILRKHDCEPKVLHCTSAYPTPHHQANLKAISTIREAINCEVGWSDHTVNPGVIYRAINKWDARIIEFHLDLDGKGDEYESGHCWLPEKIKKVINSIKNGFEADGHGVKEPVKSELADRFWRTDKTDGLRPFKSVRKNFNVED